MSCSMWRGGAVHHSQYDDNKNIDGCLFIRLFPFWFRANVDQSIDRKEIDRPHSFHLAIFVSSLKSIFTAPSKHGNWSYPVTLGMIFTSNRYRMYSFCKENLSLVQRCKVESTLSWGLAINPVFIVAHGRMNRDAWILTAREFVFLPIHCKTSHFSSVAMSKTNESMISPAL